MGTTKTKGDLAELMVAADLRQKGYKVALPFGEDWDYDLIFDRDGTLRSRGSISMEPAGLEPATSSVQARRSPN